MYYTKGLRGLQDLSCFYFVRARLAQDHPRRDDIIGDVRGGVLRPAHITGVEGDGGEGREGVSFEDVFHAPIIPWRRGGLQELF